MPTINDLLTRARNAAITRGATYTTGLPRVPAVGNAKRVVARPFPVIQTPGTNILPRTRAAIKRAPFVVPAIRTDRGTQFPGSVKPFIGKKP